MTAAPRTHSPAISVLMPVHNGAKFLAAALESLSKQTFGDFEIIAVNNGSTDATEAILAAWAKREPRLRAAYLGRPGLTLALNHAAELARAPLLARLDADDVASPQRLEVQVEVMQSRPELVLLGSSAILIDERGRETGDLRPPLLDRDIRRLQKTSAALVASTTMMRTAAFERVGGYRAGLSVSEDFDLFLRLSEIGEIANLDTGLVGYRVHSASITARQPARMAIASLAVGAAAEARRTGALEPFIAGVPHLRRALPMLRLSRKQARRSVWLRSTFNMLGRRVGTVRLPLAAKRTLHRFARLLQMKLVYRLWLTSILAHKQPHAGPPHAGRRR
jgi:glycosyltransferase involved in cell wall biosynthesis